MGEEPRGFDAAQEAALPMREASQLRDAYAIDGAFEAELAEAWTLIAPHIAGIVRELLARRGAAISDDLVRARVAYAEAKLNRPVNQAWVDAIVAEADRIAENALEFATVGASMALAQMRIHALLFELTGDPATLARLTRATQKLGVIEFEIIASRLRAISRTRAQAALRSQAAEVRAELGDAITTTAQSSRAIASFTARTAAELLALRAPAAEVSMAAEESASAMAQSARDAAALTSAYAQARDHAEAAAEVAGRADSAAVEGADNAAKLAEHTARIESIVTLIADIANQTKLLALNASIEAARAGESGRGFAIVAQEVRALADQASAAAEGITHTIREAQDASGVMAATNQTVLAVVGELLARVRGVQSTLEGQTATVTAILASIDQTALSSRGIAGLISDISARVGELATAADDAGRQAANAGTALDRIDETVAAFMKGVGR
jgi:methyl-accepting chemotaxis protein